MLEALDIWMLPCANPDGREHVLTVDDLWRQNRHDNPGTPCEGVDVNRNCDIVWGVTTSNTSCNPCVNTYLGSNRFSEPESRNIKDLCDTQRIDVLLDAHSFSELVLFPWATRAHRLLIRANASWVWHRHLCASKSAGTRSTCCLGQLRFQRVARQIVDDIRAVRGRNYTPQSILDLYATRAPARTMYTVDILRTPAYARPLVLPSRPATCLQC